jgi:hypothetical protein
MSSLDVVEVVASVVSEEVLAVHESGAQAALSTVMGDINMAEFISSGDIDDEGSDTSCFTGTLEALE